MLHGRSTGGNPAANLSALGTGLCPRFETDLWAERTHGPSSLRAAGAPARFRARLGELVNYLPIRRSWVVSISGSSQLRV